jgi:hypothetical protein
MPSWRSVCLDLRLGRVLLQYRRYTLRARRQPEPRRKQGEHAVQVQRARHQSEALDRMWPKGVRSQGIGRQGMGRQGMGHRGWACRGSVRVHGWACHGVVPAGPTAVASSAHGRPHGGHPARQAVRQLLLLLLQLLPGRQLAARLPGCCRTSAQEHGSGAAAAAAVRGEGRV